MENNCIQECPESIITTTSNEFNLLLDEITARCNKQSKGINKWLLYTKDFQQTIADTLEKEKLRKQEAGIKAMTWAPRTPRTPRTPNTLQMLN
ncbi:hypothetical protein N7516_005217 [Penicillium verrucosum]|uniref:uncharacterized protein n=1 Tax=Penicillium verrucosum TaxID=60171 RepID=UPI0025450C1A|nr:uncharacterized protein N7516_005217 [Penicillium verrucosum]KAJ5945049.1 hypothetical protein N7516_005217 [Penicillium verrucosum]